MALHPSIRIICFFCFGAYVAFGGKTDLALAVILLLMGYALVGMQHFRAVMVMLKRMRWLFLSIFIIYTWFTPGQPIFKNWINTAPTYEGIVTGFLRASSLTAIVLAVGVLVRTLSRDQLLSGILWLLNPLERIGLPYERLAVRLALTLEYVHHVQKFYTGGVVVNNSGPESATLRQRLLQISRRATDIFENVLDQSQQIDERAVMLVDEGRPPLWQWLYPVLLVGGFHLARWSYQ